MSNINSVVAEIREALADGHRLIVLTGPPRSGETTALNELARGSDVAWVGACALGDRFGPARIIDAGPAVAIDSVDLDDDLDALLSLTGDAPVAIDRMYQPLETVVPTVQVIVATNIDVPDAIAARSHVIRLSGPATSAA